MILVVIFILLFITMVEFGYLERSDEGGWVGAPRR
jgi:hypothetical protein